MYLGVCLIGTKYVEKRSKDFYQEIDHLSELGVSWDWVYLGIGCILGLGVSWGVFDWYQI